ncbi:MAG: type II toxin-antitoxin system YafQ family toxin [Tannerella sp.]|jgi:mRNA interferase YafQ|nr:type II toxin-antitoxin system YafQ family toxin [Tannerella sp.]
MNNSAEQSCRLTDVDFFVGITVIENPKYDLDYTHTFKKNVKASYRSGKDLRLLLSAVTQLVQTGKLEDFYFSHPLKGFKQIPNKKVMECHIQPNWLLVWIQEDEALTLLLFDTGTHSKLFNSKTLRKGKLK